MTCSCAPEMASISSGCLHGRADQGTHTMQAQLAFIYCQLVSMSILWSTWPVFCFSFKPGDNRAGRGQEIMVATRFYQSTTSEVSLSRKNTPDELKAIGRGNNKGPVSSGQVCRHWYYLVFKMEHTNASEMLHIPIKKHLQRQQPRRALSLLYQLQTMYH